jgi:predicted DNA-binding transcriptional regulator AlpA
VSPKSIREYVQTLRPRYHKATRPGKAQILDEACQVTGYHRKAVIRLLRRQTAPPRPRPGRPRRYAPTLQPPLLRLWEASGHLCSKRLSPFLPELLAALERHGELALAAPERAALAGMSAATIDRLLRPFRRQFGRQPRVAQRPPTAIQRRVPIRTFGDWAGAPLGSAQTDFVLHCGTWPDGAYLSTMVAVDVPTSWTEYEALWRRTQYRAGSALHRLRQRLPMGVQALHTDNDAVMLSQLIHAYCVREGIRLTRGRPYRKNDQAYAEQKIGASVRALVGYGRYSTREAYLQLQELYQLLRLQVNFFQPVAKLVGRQRVGARIVKRYDQARTPYQRVLAAGSLSDEKRLELERLYLSLNPMQLQAQITTALEKLWRLADPHY